MKREIYTAKDGKELNIAIWEEVEQPKMVLYIVHGMAEHIARYDEFAKVCNENGIIVFGDDHRAHGLTDEKTLGKADYDIFYSTYGDMVELVSYGRKKWNLPICMLGHSYGSFLAQEYICRHSKEIDACILSGSALYGGFVVGFSHFMAKFMNANKDGTFFAKMTFEKYDNKIGEGKNAWLSRDEEAVEKYTNDELCGFVCSNGFYKSFFKGVKNLSGYEFNSVRKDLPILIAYGSDDYVSNKGSLIYNLVKRMEYVRLFPTVISYAGARHEILNETNRDEVQKDMIEFLSGAINKSV